MAWAISIAVAAGLVAQSDASVTHDWRFIASSANGSEYVDVASVVAEGTARSFLLRMMFSKPIADTASIVIAAKVDCSANTFAQTGGWKFDSDGKTLGLLPLDSPPSAIQAGSDNEMIRKLVC